MSNNKHTEKISETPRVDEFMRTECCDLEHAASFARILEREIAQLREVLEITKAGLIQIREEIRNRKNSVSRVRYRLSMQSFGKQRPRKTGTARTRNLSV